MTSTCTYIRVAHFDTTRDSADIVAEVKGQWTAVAQAFTSSAVFNISGVTAFNTVDLPSSLTYAKGKKRFVARKAIGSKSDAPDYRVVAEILHHSDTVHVNYKNGHEVSK